MRSPDDCPCVECKTRRGELAGDQGLAERRARQAEEIEAYVDEVKGTQPSGPQFRSRVEREAYELDRLGIRLADDAPNSMTGGQEFVRQTWADKLARVQADAYEERPEYGKSPAAAALETMREGLPGPQDSVNPKDVAGAKKTPLSDVPAILAIAAAPVFALGAAKYGRFNWRDKPIQEKRYVEALERHLLAYKDGMRVDYESHQSHLAHIIATAAIMLDAMAYGTLLMDDKAGSGLVAALMAAKEIENARVIETGRS